MTASLLPEYGIMDLWRNDAVLVSQPNEAPLKFLSSSVLGCSISVKYFRRNNDLEIFSVVKNKLYFSFYKADIQA